MAQDVLRYDQMVQDALRGVVRRALAEVATDGFPGQHHFYITFKTSHPGVVVPDHLRATYPEEMTIVLQHQFYGLSVDDTHFEVTLSFNKALERLNIPLVAISAFVDPSVNFGLQFQVDAEPPSGLRAVPPAAQPTEAPEATPSAPSSAAVEEKTAEDDKEKIVSLDSFRKK